MYHIFFPHSSVCGHLGCFHVLTIVSSAAVGVHIGVHVFLNYSFLWICAQEWDCWIFWYLCFSEESPYCSPWWLHQLMLALSECCLMWSPWAFYFISFYFDLFCFWVFCLFIKITNKTPRIPDTLSIFLSLKTLISFICHFILLSNVDILWIIHQLSPHLPHQVVATLHLLKGQVALSQHEPSYCPEVTLDNMKLRLRGEWRCPVLVLSEERGLPYPLGAQGKEKRELKELWQYMWACQTVFYEKWRVNRDLKWRNKAGATVATVANFIFGGLQNHCRWSLRPWN